MPTYAVENKPHLTAVDVDVKCPYLKLSNISKPTIIERIAIKICSSLIKPVQIVISYEWRNDEMTSE